MKKLSLVLAVIVALALSGATAEATAPSTVPVKALEPGTLGKTLNITRIDKDKARLTIVNTKGKKESIVVLGGDIRLGLAVVGVTPEGPLNGN